MSTRVDIGEGQVFLVAEPRAASSYSAFPLYLWSARWGVDSIHETRRYVLRVVTETNYSAHHYDPLTRAQELDMLMKRGETVVGFYPDTAVGWEDFATGGE